jgi:peptidoglycan/LPS O-acetylase OafA/YrhL
MSNYRPDIDGLRAVAVLSVLFFHAGFPIFNGGFVGVDVFFVISGYLITQILIKSVDGGDFSIGEFYKRRALRILPAYTSMCLLSTLTAIWLLPPSPLIDFSESLLSSALFVANFYFAGQMNYFQSAAEELPLLHMWSLSVEEQFYVIWPFAVLIVSMAPIRRMRAPLVGAGVLVGVILCEWAIRNKSQTMVFFYTPFRAWELMIGALVAMLPTLRMGMRFSTALSVFGVILILGPVLYFEPRNPLFPGISALAPCLGAALIIATGASQRNFIHRLLSQRQVVFIGLISYSLYLWHWPLFAFMRYLNQGQLGVGLSAILCLASLGIAYLSWKLIETPFRKPHRHGPSPHSDYFGTTKVLSAATCAILFTSITASVLIYKKGLPSRASALALAASEALDSQHKLTGKCLREREPENVGLNLEGCIFGNLSERPRAVLWGDSHANSLVPAFEKRFSEEKASFE